MMSRWSPKKSAVRSAGELCRKKFSSYLRQLCWVTLMLVHRAWQLHWQNLIRRFLEKCCVKCHESMWYSWSKQYSQLYFRHWKGVQIFSVFHKKRKKYTERNQWITKLLLKNKLHLSVMQYMKFEKSIKNNKIMSAKGQLESRNSSKVFHVGKISLPKAWLPGISQIFLVWWSYEYSPF